MFEIWTASIVSAFFVLSLVVYVRNEVAIAAVSRTQSFMFSVQQFIGSDKQDFQKNPESFCQRTGIKESLDKHKVGLAIITEEEPSYEWQMSGSGPMISIRSLKRHPEFLNLLFLRSNSGGATMSVPWMYMNSRGKLKHYVVRAFSIDSDKHVLLCAFT